MVGGHNSLCRVMVDRTLRIWWWTKLHVSGEGQNFLRRVVKKLLVSGGRQNSFLSGGVPKIRTHFVEFWTPCVK